MEAEKKYVMQRQEVKETPSLKIDGLKQLKFALMREELGEHYVDHHHRGAIIEHSEKPVHHALSVAAYLRCLFAAIECAPTTELRDHSVKQLQDLFVFRSITQLCDAVGWAEANIGAKYLRVARHVLRARATDSNDHRLHHYEIVSVAIQSILEECPRQDETLVGEVAATCQLMLRQAIHLHHWSDVISHPHRCEAYRRPPQAKITDKFVQALFDEEVAHALVTILFTAEGEASEDIKRFLGDYLRVCKKLKYGVLEALMKGMVFDKRPLRETFLQEILAEETNSGMRSGFERYIEEKRLGFEDDGGRERVLEMAQGVLVGTGSSWQPRILVLTNKGLRLFKQSTTKRCAVCPAETMCQYNPKLDQRYRYDQISCLITTPGIE